jgi:hypothetical protein
LTPFSKEKTMRATKRFLIACALAGAFLAVQDAEARSSYRRQYYSSYYYNPTYSYYYSYYYYKPYDSYAGYNYHYCIYYPSQPRYVYYYNPYSSQYWGRYDLKGKKGEEYSLLAEKDRKSSLKEIPESAFPKPAAMPKVPDAKDDVAIEAPTLDLPKDVNPKDLPKDDKAKELPKEKK